MSNITITLTSLSTNQTDSIEISSSMTLNDLCLYAIALLGLSNDNNIILIKNGQRLYNHSNKSSSSSVNGIQGSMTLSSVGIQNGDLIVVLDNATGGSGGSSSGQLSSSRLPTAVTTSTISTNNSSNNNGGSNGGLDFSSLLASSANTNIPLTTSNITNNNNITGGLQFNLSLLSGGGGGGSLFGGNNNNSQIIQSNPVQWDGMTLDDAIERNPNPGCFVQVLLDEARHGNLMKELNYYHPTLAKKLKNAGGVQVSQVVFKFVRLS